MPIFYQNKPDFEQKVSTMIADGADNLHIVTDFDRTLTPNFIKGERKPSSIAYFRDRQKNYMPASYVEAAHKLADHYHPIEIDPHMPDAEKAKFMLEWWTKHQELLVREKISQQVIDRILREEILLLRSGTKDLLELCSQACIPVLIFSAGIGNLIEGLLKREKLITPNLHIVSNFFNFDSNGIATGFSNKIIHILNKHEQSIKDTPYYQEVDKRDNVIEMGDRSGDARMTEGLAHKTILRIGFLNENVAENLANYLKKFDLVITDDEPMTPVLNLLKQVCA